MSYRHWSKILIVMSSKYMRIINIIGPRRNSGQIMPDERSGQNALVIDISQDRERRVIELMILILKIMKLYILSICYMSNTI